MRSFLACTLCFTLGLAFGLTPAQSNQRREVRPRIEMPVANDFTGIFSISGIEEGEPYKGVAYIRKVRGVFLVNVVWHDQLESISGIGQAVDGNLCIGWAHSTGKAKGSTVYKKDGPNLYGTAVIWPGGGRNTESLSFLKGAK